TGNLIIDKRKLSQTIYSFDTLFTYAISTRGGVIIPQMNIIWKHEFNDDADIVQGRFRNDPDKVTFSFDTEIPDTDYFKLNLGVSQILPGGNTGFIYYERILSKDSYSLSNLSLGIRIPLNY
ncbi:MAG: autotransporter domain-containing protein, partial [Thiohalomonadales bacterium]